MVPLQISGRGVNQEKPESKKSSEFPASVIMSIIWELSSLVNRAVFFFLCPSKSIGGGSWRKTVRCDGGFCSWWIVIRQITILSIAKILNHQDLGRLPSPVEASLLCKMVLLDISHLTGMVFTWCLCSYLDLSIFLVVSDRSCMWMFFHLVLIQASKTSFFQRCPQQLFYVSVLENLSELWIP